MATKKPSTWNWWTRPCGGRDVLGVALPLVLASLSATVMIFIDRMFLLWYSTDAVAAAMPAGMFQFTIACFPLGIATYINTFVAQYEGAGLRRRVGSVVWQGIWIGVFAMPLVLATIPWAASLFTLAGHAPRIVANEAVFYRALSFGSGAVIIAAAQASFFTGRGATLVVLAIDLSATLLNVLLDYLWIFGHLGFPAGGIAGAGWATTVAEWARVLLYGLVMLRPVYRHSYQLIASWRLDWQVMRRLWRFGAAGGLQMFAELAGFTIFLLLVGRLGEQAMVATTLAFNVNSVAWVPMMGLGVAVSTLVGQQLGGNRPELAARATWTALWLALGYMGTMAALYLVVPDWFLCGYAAGTAAETFLPLRALTVVLLRFVAVYCLFDAMNLVFVNAIRGAGDMRFVLATTLLMAPLPLAVTWWGLAYGGYGLLWCWLVITVWICALGLIYMGRFLQGRWRQMRVIEPEVLMITTGICR